MVEYARILTKSSEGPPTIPPSASHDNGDWSSNDIYENELYIDSLNGYFYTRRADTIVLISTAGFSFTVEHDASLTGDGSSTSPLGVALDPSPDNLAELTANGILVSPTKWIEIEVLNGLSDPLPKMSVCYFKTSSSSADTPEVLLADNSSEATSSKTMGILKDTIAPGERGKLILVGEYDHFDTSAYNVGDRLWLGTLGGIVTTPPAAPKHAVFLGIVSRSQHTNGRICVSIQNGYELEELHNVTTESYVVPEDGDKLLIFDSVNSLWKRLSFENLKIQLRAFFDAFYQPKGDIGVANITTNAPLATTGGTNPDLSISEADATTDGFITAVDWNRFDAKQDALTLTTTGTSGPATLVGDTLNIPQYSVGGGGFQGVHALLPLKSGQSTYAGTTSQGLAGAATASNRLYAVPFIPNQNITTSALYMNVTTLGIGAKSRILIYSNLNGLPDQKLYESADLDCSTLGVKTATTTFNFVAGTTYWLSLHTNLPFNASFINTSGLIPLAIAGTANPNTFVFTIVTFGSAPTTFGTPTITNGNAPFIGITKA